MIIDWKILLLFITSGFNFAMSLFLFIKNYRDRSHILFALVALFAGLWSLGMGMFLSTSLDEIQYFWLQFYYFTALCLAPLFYYFAVCYAYPVRAFKLWGVIAHLICVSILMWAIFRPDFLVVREPWEMISLNPVSYIIYAIYFLVVLVSGFVTLIAKWKMSEGYVRRQLLIVIVAILIASISGVYFDLLLPFYTYRHIVWGPYFTAVMCVIIYVALFIKPIKE